MAPFSKEQQSICMIFLPNKVENGTTTVYSSSKTTNVSHKGDFQITSRTLSTSSQFVNAVDDDAC